MDTPYEVWVNGAQLISLPVCLSDAQKSDVLDSQLLAQVFANKDTLVADAPRAWFQHNKDGLTKLKWNTPETQSDVPVFQALDELSIVELVASHLVKELPASVFKQLTAGLEHLSGLEYKHPTRQLFRGQVLSRGVDEQGHEVTHVNFQASACNAPNHVFSLFVSLTLGVPLQENFLHQEFYGADCVGEALFFYSHRSLSPALYSRVRERVVHDARDYAGRLRLALPKQQGRASA